MALGTYGHMLCYIWISIYMIDPVRPCDMAAVRRCSESAFGVRAPPNFKGIPRSETLRPMCSKYRVFKSCAQPLLAGCEGNTFPDVIYRSFYSVATYLCGSLYNDILNHASCWDQNDVQNSMQNCASSTIIHPGPIPDCSDIHILNECMTTAITPTCGQDAATLLNTVLVKVESAVTYPQTCDTNSGNSLDLRYVTFVSLLLVVMTLSRMW